MRHDWREVQSSYSGRDGIADLRCARCRALVVDKPVDRHRVHQPEDLSAWWWVDEGCPFPGNGLPDTWGVPIPTPEDRARRVQLGLFGH